MSPPSETNTLMAIIVKGEVQLKVRGDNTNEHGIIVFKNKPYDENVTSRKQAASKQHYYYIIIIATVKPIRQEKTFVIS